MSIESVMPCNCLILCRPLLLLPSIFLSIRVFSSELDLQSLLLMSSGGIGTSYSCTISQLQIHCFVTLETVPSWFPVRHGQQRAQERCCQTIRRDWKSDCRVGGRDVPFSSRGLLSTCSSRSARMGPGSPHLSGPRGQAAGSIFRQVSMPPSGMPAPLTTRLGP